MIWKLVWVLRTYRSYNSMVRFSKYEFYNELLGSIISRRVTQNITWIQPFIYICIYIYIERERYITFLQKFAIILSRIVAGLCYLFINPLVWSTCYGFFKPALSSLLEVRNCNPLLTKDVASFGFPLNFCKKILLYIYIY